MNVDITTEHVAMRPEWHDIIGAWLEQCRRRHPEIDGVDFALRHVDFQPAGETVDLIALTRGTRHRATTQATDMQLALYDALDALERELASNKAIRP